MVLKMKLAKAMVLMIETMSVSGVWVKAILFVINEYTQEVISFTQKTLKWICKHLNQPHSNRVRKKNAPKNLKAWGRTCKAVSMSLSKHKFRGHLYRLGQCHICGV